MENITQRCPNCQLDRTREWFHQSAWGNLGMPCAPCKGVHNKQLYQAPGHAGMKRLRHQYKRLGLAGRRLEEMMRAQRYLCACCKVAVLDQIPSRLVVPDVDERGHTRALLCHECMRWIRLLRKPRPPGVDRYLRKWPTGA
jgi:hypothetical protein